jgi:hypothetical protein
MNNSSQIQVIIISKPAAIPHYPLAVGDLLLDHDPRSNGEPLHLRADWRVPRLGQCRNNDAFGSPLANNPRSVLILRVILGAAHAVRA